MKEAIYEGSYFDLRTYLDAKENQQEAIKKLKKGADKGAFTCPYCGETLILRSGEIREEHFAHRHSKSCEISIASEVYQKQVKRESKKHSVLKEIIYDELKSQEKTNEDINVDYGYVTKGTEKWKYYPDIILKNKEKKFALTILTDVTYNKDSKLVKQIKNRNKFFKSKKLTPIWFVEDAEQSVDIEKHVIHLWEAELDIATKTKEDLVWEDALNSLSLDYSIFKLFNYQYREIPNNYEVYSLYYVHSTDTNIEFTVQRFIKDDDQMPYRAFAINKGYQMSLSTALLAKEDLQLSNPSLEKQHRDAFLQEIQERQIQFDKYFKEQILHEEKSKKVLNIKELNLMKGEVGSTRESVARINIPITPISQHNHIEELKRAINLSLKSQQKASAMELCEFLVEAGASSECYPTGRYKIYPHVCQYLDSLTKKGVLKLENKDSVNDRVYSVLNNDF